MGNWIYFAYGLLGGFLAPRHQILIGLLVSPSGNLGQTRGSSLEAFLNCRLIEKGRDRWTDGRHTDNPKTSCHKPRLCPAWRVRYSCRGGALGLVQTSLWHEVNGWNFIGVTLSKYSRQNVSLLEGISSTSGQNKLLTMTQQNRVEDSISHQWLLSWVPTLYLWWQHQIF